MIRFDLPVASEVGLSIHDIAGRRVRTLVLGSRPAGSHQVIWDGRDDRSDRVASGVYFLRLQARPLAGEAGFVAVRKLLLLE